MDVDLRLAQTGFLLQGRHLIVPRAYVDLQPRSKHYDFPYAPMHGMMHMDAVLLNNNP